MKRTWIGLMGTLAIAHCHLGVDEEQPWNLGERRQVLEAARAVPRSPLEAGEFEIFAPLGIEAQKLALAARDALTVRRGALVQGISSSLGTVSVETGARLGHLYALGESAPVLGERAALSGYLRLRPEHEMTLVKPRLGIARAAPVAERFEWQVAFPSAQAPACMPEPSAQTVALEPNGYGELVIGAGVTVALRSGHYFFTSLSLREGGRLEFDNMAGPIYVWIDRALEVAGRVMPDIPHGNVLFGYGGSAPVGLQGFDGTLVAPAAEVRVHAGIPSIGAIFAARIVLEAAAVFTHRPFEVAPPEADIIAICQHCALAMAAQPKGRPLQVRPECLDCPLLAVHAPRLYRGSCASAQGD
jgi:hypothetical protein